MGYHSWDIGILTCDHESGRGTLSGGQFDWGGRLLKGNGGAQRFAQHGRKSCNECKRKSEPNCENDGSSSNEELELVIRRYVNGNAVAQRIKATLGITG